MATPLPACAGHAVGADAKNRRRAAERFAAYSAPGGRHGTGTPGYARSETAAVTWAEALRVGQ